MTNQEIIQKLGQTTEAFETKIKELSPFYTNLEPWQRGTLILALFALLLISIYLLAKPSQVNYKVSQKEKELEERILRQMAFYKRLKE